MRRGRSGACQTYQHPIVRKDRKVAGSEPVTSPDQRKPGHRKAGQIGAIISAAALVLMMFNNNNVTGTERIWLGAIAASLVVAVIGDAVLRRNGLRS